MKHVLILLPTHDFKDVDYTEPLAVIKHEGHSVVVAATEWKCRGSLGTEVTANLLVRNVVPHDYDAIYVVGGEGARDYAVDISVIEMIQEFAHGKKLIGAIGNGVVVPAAAELLKNRWVAAAAPDEEYLISKGAKLARKTVVLDGNMLTAVGSRAAHESAVLFTNILH